ncbi:MAG: DUF3800 domain-containing protein [Candidatus Woesearchaeota archaeon]
MNYIYIDESGYLGINKKNSKYFVISAALITDEETHKRFVRIPKKIRQRKLKKSLKKQSELKFSNSSVVIREQFLNRVAKLPVQVYTLIIKKENTSFELRKDLNILYNYLIKRLLEETLPDVKQNDKLVICLDECMSAKQKERFEEYIKTEFLALFEKLPHVRIEHQQSHHEPGLQVIDFICGAFGYKYNTAKLQDDFEHYTNIIEENIKLEKNDLFKEKKANRAYLS